jgi:hypothetical protein
MEPNTNTRIGSKAARVLAILAVAAAGAASAATTISHSAIGYFVPAKRINIDARIDDPSGIKLARVYFKPAAQADYLLVPMRPEGASRFVGTIPAPSPGTAKLEYLVLAVNNEGQVSRTDAYTVGGRNSRETPTWQSAPSQEPVKVYTELPSAPTPSAAFSDSISMDVVESGARFGAVAGLYGAQAGGAAGGAAGSSGTTTAATTSATAGGLSTAAIVGGIAVAGGLAAAASGGGGGGGGGGGSPASFAGNWSGTESGSINVTCPSQPSQGGTCSFTIPFSGTVNSSNVFNGSTSPGNVQCSSPALGSFAQVITQTQPISFTIGSNGTSPIPGYSESQSGVSITCAAGSINFSSSSHSVTGSQSCNGNFSGPPACNFTFSITYH